MSSSPCFGRQCIGRRAQPMGFKTNQNACLGLLQTVIIRGINHLRILACKVSVLSIVNCTLIISIVYLANENCEYMQVLHNIIERIAFNPSPGGRAGGRRRRRRACPRQWSWVSAMPAPQMQDDGKYWLTVHMHKLNTTRNLSVQVAQFALLTLNL